MHCVVNTTFVPVVLLTLIIINLRLSTSRNTYDTSTLELAHIVFRHGNRTVEVNFSYPTDPYINETYQPFGLGQLTNKGKLKEFLLGKIIRLRYDKFLGSIYSPGVIDPVSTEYDRTKMSLELFLAGLYPPKGTVMEWHKELNWQPIPYNYFSSRQDFHLFSVPLTYCPKYIKLYQEYINSKEGQILDQKYSNLYGYLTKHIEMNVTSLLHVGLIYVTFIAQEDWGFKLPAWSDKIYPEVLDRAVGDFFIGSSSTPELKQLSGGFLLKKIINDTQAKIKNMLNYSNRKLVIYSAHDLNIAYLLSAMNVYYPHEPTYGACVLVEVHKINGVYGIKVYYHNYKRAEPELLRIPGCNYFCRFDKFVELLKGHLPQGDDPCEDKKEDH